MDAAEAYETNARAFMRGRESSRIGAGVVGQWADSLRKGAEVIELGCGAGQPVTAVLQASGLKVWAVDASPTLLAEFHTRFPQIRVRCERVQSSGFFERKFEAAIAIGLLFLLPEPEQLALIAKISEILISGGRLLFTAPLQVGTWVDSNTGLECRSLGKERYERLLARSDFRTIATRTDEGANNYYEAIRT